MAFVRSSEPFQEPPQPRSRGALVIGIAVLFVFFVPLLVVIATSPGNAPAPVTGTALAATPDRPTRRLPPPMPPLPPEGAPWPPPPGAPQPPVCTLEFRVSADGSTSWTALTTLDGRLAVTAVAEGRTHREEIRLSAGVRPVALPASLSQDHRLRASLSGSGGRRFDCLVGAQA